MTLKEKFNGDNKLEALFFEWVESAELVMEAGNSLLQAEESLNKVKQAAEINPARWESEIPVSENILALAKRKHKVLEENMKASWKNYRQWKSKVDLNWVMENTIPIATL